MTQSTDKHTPGQFEVAMDGREMVIQTPSHAFPLWGGDGPGKTAVASKRIAIICKFGMTPEEQMANANLLAAAPEMLSALKAIAALKRHDANQGEQPNPRYLTLNVKAILIADIEAAIQAASPAHQKEEAHG